MTLCMTYEKNGVQPDWLRRLCIYGRLRYAGLAGDELEREDVMHGALVPNANT